MATRKLFTKKQPEEAIKETSNKSYRLGYDEGKAYGESKGRSEERCRLENTRKERRVNVLVDTLTKLNVSLDAVAHLAVVISKETL